MIYHRFFFVRPPTPPPPKKKKSAKKRMFPYRWDLSAETSEDPKDDKKQIREMILGNLL